MKDSEHHGMLRQLAADLLEDDAAAHARTIEEPGKDDLAQGLWQRVVELDWPLVGIDAERGGAGGSLQDLLVLVEATGYHGAPVPLAEIALGAWVTAAAGRTPDSATLVAPPRAPDALSVTDSGAGLVLRGRLPRVPWARSATRVVVFVGTAREPALVVGLGDRGVSIRSGANVAGEPRDDTTFESVTVAPADALDATPAWDEVFLRGALLRVAATVGALDRVMDLTRAHVLQREQFGRPLARFQLVSAQLATMAVEQRTARASYAAAVAGAARGDFDRVAILAARIASARAATAGAQLAHQLHGAIGTTREHALHRFTRRLWAWRDEWISEHQATADLGVLALNETNIWEWITSRAAH